MADHQHLAFDGSDIAIGPQTHEHGSDDTVPLAELLDLDGEVLHSYWRDAIAAVHQAASGAGYVRILDMGAGTGVGTIALARQFSAAEVIAVDLSEQMLSRVQSKALELGLDSRIRTVHADLDVACPALGDIDITWASNSLHHMADPNRTLREVFSSTRPGGLVAVAEMAERIRFLPDDIGFGRPGLETRCLDALRSELAHSLPTLGADWSRLLHTAGFDVLGEQTFTIELTPPHSPAAARYAQLWLRRMRSGLARKLNDDDLQTLAILIDDGPESVQQRSDLHIRGTRTLTLGRRQ